jgi:hypothetical protein
MFALKKDEICGIILTEFENKFSSFVALKASPKVEVGFCRRRAGGNSASQTSPISLERKLLHWQKPRS